MPFFPFLNNPFKVVHRHNTNNILQKTSKTLEPWPPQAGGCIPKNAIASVMSWTNKRAVIDMKTNRDSSKVESANTASVAPQTLGSSRSVIL